MAKIQLEKPDDCFTVWEIQRDYGISKQTICRAIRKGKLNGFMLGTEEYVVLKWYVICDELFNQYIEKFQSK